MTEIPIPPMPPSHGYRVPRGRRSGHDTLEDLLDAPEALRNIATFDRPMDFPEDGDPQLIGRDDLLRWANAIEEFVDAPRWKAYAYLAGVFLAGLIIGLGL